MSVATTVRYALSLTRVDYEILRHAHTDTSAETARQVHLDPCCLAKAVVLKDHIGYLLAVVPASEKLDVARLCKALHRPTLALVPETELDEVFYDCEVGSVPPLGPEYRIPTVVDPGLRGVDDVYFEAGDHEKLVHVDQTSFRQLMRGAEYLDITASAA
ncbi:MAG: YbaK/EbsC family protein [Gammaproteobacteria bacterium]